MTKVYNNSNRIRIDVEKLLQFKNKNKFYKLNSDRYQILDKLEKVFFIKNKKKVRKENN